ncbi:methanogenesis marker 7 protein [Methanosalsum natronophilum]|uniref:Methanogenesis marker 7 protein n=1 Tax=Methanosalsum natronophilum TaxID=768733 RepID=A0A3R7VZD2_9EURY|nr:methanogenesis marker 7 protein [Methanosalsum natronophilum]MCS3924021.1 putative methanogenesis marker protein 7 [Methanosalsum natronophilum]RQD92373.1 MAG: methanogenesis marker 7 protein [Methanosalsum natronophilum]
MSQVLEPYIYEGGIHKHGLILELLEDIGGYLVQKTPAATEVTLIMLIPKDDVPLVEDLAKKLLGKVTRAPLTGVEIAVVSPTLAYHHLPHSACDIAEHLRRDGANTNMIGLARGMGRRVANLNNYEGRLINEHDIALYSFGIFRDCIKTKKMKLFEGINIPIIVTGGPEIATEEVPGSDLYIGNIGRIPHRMRKSDELDALDTMNKKVGELIDSIRDDLSKDPLVTIPARVMKEVHEQVPAINKVLTPSPITLQLDGLRIKLPYDEYKSKIHHIEFDEGFILGDIANISPSNMKNYILVKIKRESDIGFSI